MKNKIQIKYIILIVIILVLTCGYFYLKNYETRIYGLFDMIEEKDGKISMRVLDVGSNSYKGYDLVKVEDGVYEFILKGGIVVSPFVDTLFPVIIEIDNKDNHIKKIIQENPDKQQNQGENDYEIIYPSEKDY